MLRSGKGIDGLVMVLVLSFQKLGRLLGPSFSSERLQTQSVRPRPNNTLDCYVLGTVTVFDIVLRAWVARLDRT